MKRVAGYARVSTVSQVQDGTSLDAQKKKIYDKCQKEGYELVNTYADGGVSGGSMQRPQLKQLIKDAKDRKFDAVLFTKLDRLGRSVRDIYNLYHQLYEELHLDLICIDDPTVIAEGGKGRLMLGMFAVFAEFERTMIRERTVAGRKSKWEEGTAIVGDIPYGYKRGEAPGAIEIDEEQARIYGLIVNMYLIQRMSTKKIAIQLTTQAVPVPSVAKGKCKNKPNRHWWGTTIVDMLRNPAYKGEVKYNKKVHVMKNAGRNGIYFCASKEQKPEDQWVTVKLPRLISDEEWQQVQDRMENQKIKPKRNYRGYEDNFLFDGLVYCAECGRRMQKRIIFDKGSKQPRLVYKCFWHDCSDEELTHSNQQRCIMTSTDANLADSQVFSQITDMLTRPRDFAELWLKRLDVGELEAKGAELGQREKELERQLKEGFVLMRSTTNKAERGLYIKEQNKTRELWEETRRELEKTYKELDLATNKAKRFEEFERLIRDIGNGSPFKAKAMLCTTLENLPFADKRRIVDAIVSPEQGGKIQIGYVRPSDFLDVDDMTGMSDEEKNRPLKDRPHCVVGDFSIDINRLQAVLNSLNNSALLRQVSSRRVP